MYNIVMFPLQISRMEQVIELPRNANIISVVNQAECPVLNAIVNSTTNQTDSFSFLCFGNGDSVDNAQGYSFLGTTVFMGGRYVYHWFYKKI